MHAWKRRSQPCRNAPGNLSSATTHIYSLSGACQASSPAPQRTGEACRRRLDTHQTSAEHAQRQGQLRSRARLALGNPGFGQ
eukprot:6752496-Pyramimonas_sp.AAC.1